MTKLSIVVRALWDPEAEIFVATSDDVPGLVAEARNPKEMLEKLQLMVPELLELNFGNRFGNTDMREVPLYVVREQMSKICIPA